MPSNKVFNIDEATVIRNHFISQLESINGLLQESESQGRSIGSSGELGLKSSIKNLTDEIEKLKNGKFRFLVIGDFNRGKSSILNVLLGRWNLLPIGAIATTAIPTFIKYGDREKVVVYFKNGRTEEFNSVQDYKDNITLNSKRVKDKIKQFFNNLGDKWLNQFDYAEIYYPIELLLQGVEFIDTAGLNHTPEETAKTLEFIEKCHGVMFVLSAEQQLTDQEQKYLKQSIKGKLGGVFFLINKWELTDQSDEKDIHTAFVEGLSESLGLDEYEIEQMWGNRIFDVRAKNALTKLENRHSLEGTGFLEFTEKINYFLVNEKLISELYTSIDTTRNTANFVNAAISDRLLVLNDSVKTVDEKIQKARPHIKIMKRITQSLAREISLQKENCSEAGSKSYESYFIKRVNNFDLEFKMPDISGFLNEGKRNEYTEKLTDEFTKYQQDKLAEWNNISQADVMIVGSQLMNLLTTEISNYENEKQEIREILNGNNQDVKSQLRLVTSEGGSIENTNLTTINAKATGKIIGAVAGGTVGTAVLGIGAVTASNVFLHTAITIGFLNPVTGGLLALTPVGWGLIGAGVIVGGIGALFAHGSEADKFKKGMQQQLKNSLQKSATDEDKLLAIKNNIKGLFSGFEKVNQQLIDDIESLEKSLENLLESKKQNEVNSQSEEIRLQSLSKNISDRWELMNAKYTEISENISFQGEIVDT
jgi:GTPase SAR1 family protein